MIEFPTHYVPHRHAPIRRINPNASQSRHQCREPTSNRAARSSAAIQVRPILVTKSSHPSSTHRPTQPSMQPPDLCRCASHDAASKPRMHVRTLKSTPSSRHLQTLWFLAANQHCSRPGTRTEDLGERPRAGPPRWNSPRTALLYHASLSRSVPSSVHGANIWCYIIRQPLTLNPLHLHPAPQTGPTDREASHLILEY